MVSPRLSPSALLSSSPELKSIEAPSRCGQISGSSFRRRQTGALDVTRLRVASGGQASPTNVRQPLLFADSGRICEDLSKITGSGRVQLVAGDLDIEAQRFDLRHDHQIFLASQVVVRSRNPQLRLSARRLRARFRVDSEGQFLVDELSLVGAVGGTVAISWCRQELRFELSARKVSFRFGEGPVEVSVAGSARQPASFRSHEHSCWLETKSAKLVDDGHSLRCVGELSGSVELRGISPLLGKRDGQPAMSIRLTEAGGFRFRRARQEPGWWTGLGEAGRADSWLEIVEPKRGAQLLGERLSLLSPCLNSRSG